SFARSPLPSVVVDLVNIAPPSAPNPSPPPVRGSAERWVVAPRAPVGRVALLVPMVHAAAMRVHLRPALQHFRFGDRRLVGDLGGLALVLSHNLRLRLWRRAALGL